SYNSIMVAAIAPALIYYAYLMLAVQLRASNMGLDARASAELDQVVDLKAAAARQWHLLISIATLVWLLVTGTPAGTAALIAVLMVLGLDAIVTIARGRGNGASFIEAGSRILNGIAEGARAGAMVATVIAVIGVLIEVLTVTGFAQKLSFAMLDLSDGSLFTLSIVVAASCLVFGLGLPTSASYFIVALFGAPALVELGVPLLAAHMFVFYFANLSAVTPPVAVAALVGANIAKASFWGTSFEAVRLALPGFLLPFLFLFEPEILGIGKGFGAQLLAIAQALLATAALNFALEGRIFNRVSVIERVILAAAALGLLYWVTWLEIVSAVAIIAMIAWSWLQAKRDVTIKAPS
ncbi:MAG TPA: TRAP transporter large permease subunit, partial [Hyphomicrobiaceae bacterium]|nr:TRAP transporter large permease subunit [Hyphomicrobiaceae bacterium]